MVSAKTIVLLALGHLSVLAKDFTDENSNFTFTLYPSDAGDTCEEGGNGSLTLTTSTVPRVLTCIEVEGIVSSNNRTGFLNDTTSHLVIYPEGFDESRLPPPGIEFYIPSGLGDFDASKNWTNLWFRRRNATGDGETEEGELGRWIVTTYANNECIRTNVTETPWYETSCQTDEENQCESVSYSIKNIGMRPFDGKNGDFSDGCQEWGKVGAAASLMPHLSAALEGVMAHFVLL